MTPADRVAAQRALYVEKLNELIAQLNDARAQLPLAEAAERAAKVEYDELYSFVMAPSQRLDGARANVLTEMPAATHSWLYHEAKEPSKLAKSTLHALQRLITQLENDCSKWRGEIDFIDTVLNQDGKVAALRPVAVKSPKPDLVEFDNITLPAVRA